MTTTQEKLAEALRAIAKDAPLERPEWLNSDNHGDTAANAMDIEHYRLAQIAIQALQSYAAEAAQPQAQDALRVVVDQQGVRFGPSCWFSHEKITGLPAGELNKRRFSNGRVAVGKYMQWVDAMLAAPQQAAEPVAWTLIFEEGIGVNAPTTFKRLADAEDYADACAIPDKCNPFPERPRVIPLYTHPQPTQDAEGKDAARLDWLAEHAAYVMFYRSTAQTLKKLIWRDLRHAIDSEMAREAGK